MTIGLMARSDYSGLGNQTRRMAQLIKPDRIILINSEGFSKNAEQHPDWYDSFSGYVIQGGFPTDREARIALKGLTHFICCENPMNTNFYRIAREMGVKTYCVVNYEFLDTLNRPDMAEPDFFIMPSYWKLEEMKARYGAERVIYLPPPLSPLEFSTAFDTNIRRSTTRSILHTVGTLAMHDRNGTLDLLAALKHTNAEFNLTITSQQELPPEYITNDHRVSYKIGSCKDPQEIYNGYDALFLPRRYAGLCLPCNEALMSGLIVVMPNISPNDQLLKPEWLIPAMKKGSFMARAEIDYYECNPVHIANGIESFCKLTDEELNKYKVDAFDIAYFEFAPDSLRERYEKLWTL